MLKEYVQRASLYLPFWNNLTDEQKNSLNIASKHLKGFKGEMLHGGLNDCSGVLIVLNGSLRSYILSAEGREVTLYRIGVGDVCIFSASCILKNINFEVFISSEINYEAVLISTKAYEKIKQENNEVETFTNSIIAERFSNVMWSVEKILFMSFDKRLALYLLENCELTGTKIIEQTHDEIAKNTGSAREVVTRMLKYFALEGYVTLSRGNITIVDEKGLKKLI